MLRFSFFKNKKQKKKGGNRRRFGPLLRNLKRGSKTERNKRGETKKEQ